VFVMLMAAMNSRLKAKLQEKPFGFGLTK